MADQSYSILTTDLRTRFDYVTCSFASHSVLLVYMACTSIGVEIVLRSRLRFLTKVGEKHTSATLIIFHILNISYIRLVSLVF